MVDSVHSLSYKVFDVLLASCISFLLFSNEHAIGHIRTLSVLNNVDVFGSMWVQPVMHTVSFKDADSNELNVYWSNLTLTKLHETENLLNEAKFTIAEVFVSVS